MNGFGLEAGRLRHALGSPAGRGAGQQADPVSAIVHSFARCGDPLAGGNRRGVPDRGHKIAMPARLDAQNAEAVLGIVVRDPFDETRQNFLGGGVGARLQPDIHEVLSSEAVKNPPKA
jgi:hypothetical protein